MKSRCAPMSAEDRQAHHLFISHHCRITARWLGRLVGSLCSAWHHLASLRNPPYRPKPSLFPSRIRPIGRISPICLPDTRFYENLGSHFITRNHRFFPSRIRPIGRISPICLPGTRFSETSALTSSPETLAFSPLVFVLLVVSVPFAFPIPDFPKPRLSLHHPKPSFFPLSYSSYWSYQSYMPSRYPMSSRNSLLFRNLCPFLFVLPLLPIRDHISSRNSKCPFHQRETWSIFAPLRNLEWLSCFAKLCGRSRISRNLIRLFFLFPLFGFFAF